MIRKNDLLAADKALIRDVRRMIESARLSVAATINIGLSKLYWEIGKRIHQEILKGDRADYGKQILATLSQELSQSYGSGFSYSALTRMVKFHESFRDEKIVATLSQQLSWSHFRELLPLEKPLQHDFYRTGVLCAGKKRETVELLALENSGIRVAEYLTELPPRKVLEQKLHTAIEQAKREFQNRLELPAGKDDDEPTR